jgi:hypothetical protein
MMWGRWASSTESSSPILAPPARFDGRLISIFTGCGADSHAKAEEEEEEEEEEDAHLLPREEDAEAEALPRLTFASSG